MKQNFYVYALFRFNGLVCYIGKGSGDRIYRHERHARGGECRNPHLKNIIKLADGAVPKVIIRSEMFEDEAFELEKVFIQAIGREVNGGPLVNLTDGGEGPSGLVFTKRSKEMIGSASKRNWRKRSFKDKVSKSHSEYWMNPKHRSERGEATKQGFTEIGLLKKKASHCKYWSDPKNRKAQSIRLKKIKNSLETRAKISEAAKLSWSKVSKETMNALSEKRKELMRLQWLKKREKMCAAVRAGWIKRKARSAQI